MASVVGTVTNSTSRRTASCFTSSITGRAPAAPVPAPDLSPAWPAVAGASLVALGLLTVVGLLIARALGARFTLGRIREFL